MNLPGTPVPGEIWVLGVPIGSPHEHPWATQDIAGLEVDLLIGGTRHLETCPIQARERMTITGTLDPILDRLKQALQFRERVLVLATGDPLCYGIGTTLLRHFPVDCFRFFPAPSAFQRAFAALKEPWSDALLLSVHGRPLDSLLDRLPTSGKVAILTDPVHHPGVVARTLLEIGLPGDTPCAVCEALGTPEENIVRAPLNQILEWQGHPLSVMVLWLQEGSWKPRRELDDERFLASRIPFTRREIRLLALAELALSPGQIFWDIGAGSGAISLEAACRTPGLQIYAVERDPNRVQWFRTQIRDLGLRGIHIRMAEAPQGLDDFPDPHGVFIGGSGGHLEALLSVVQARLRPGGRVVLSFVLLEHLMQIRNLLPQTRIYQVQIHRGQSLRQGLRFQPLNPVWLAVWQRPL